MSASALLLISNGHAEDLIGAALGRELRRLSPESRLLALPLVGGGRAYAGVAEVAGPVLNLPSGGFPFGSLENLRADLRAGLVGTSLGQAVAARLRGTEVGRVIVVGDTYALALGALAAGAVPGAHAGRRLPLVHLQPLVSVLYAQDMGVRGHLRELNALGANAFMPWEIALGRRAERVYTRDAASARHLARRGVNAAYRGGFAPDILPPPERELAEVRDSRPVLALLPGQRGDARTSLPVMLDAAAHLPEVQALVAWPRDWAELPPLPGWEVRPESDSLAWATRGEMRVGLLRGAFSAILHAAAGSGGLALGTAGTASEQAAALGVPVVGFPTAGPQYVPGFAARQARLLGAALTLSAPEGQAVAAAVRALYQDGLGQDGLGQDGLGQDGLGQDRPGQDGRRLAFARAQGRERMGAPGALARIAREILGE